MLEIKPVRAFTDNYIWVIGRPGHPGAVVVDPGDAGPVQSALSAWHLKLEAILVTHHHGDHVGGVSALLQDRPVPVFGPGAEDIPHCTIPLRGGDAVSLPGLGARLEVIDVPGHTRGHIAYHGHGVLFAGDTLFMAGCGRLFEGTPDQMFQSLERMASLPGETLVYCAHEYTLANLDFARTVEPGNRDIATRMEVCRAQRDRGEPTVPGPLRMELATNPFLRTRVPAVKAAVAEHLGSVPGDPVSVFAALREWKNQF